MYSKHQENKQPAKFNARLSFLHGKTKETIEQIFLKNKLFGWGYDIIPCSVQQIMGWLPDGFIVNVNGKEVFAHNDVLKALTYSEIGERTNITVQTCMSHIRKDAPHLTNSIINIVKVGPDAYQIVSEYNHVVATAKINKTEAELIAQGLLADMEHEIHNFIKVHSVKYPNTSIKIFKETLENWSKVF